MNNLSFCYKLQIPKYQIIHPFVTQTTDSKVSKLHSLSKYAKYLNIKLSHSMNGSNVRGSLSPYGDASPCSNGIFTRQGVFSFQNCHNNWWQFANQPSRKKMPSVIWNLFDFITYWYSYYSQLHEATYFSYKYVLHLNMGKTSPKGSY